MEQLFREWPKIPRWGNESFTISEKIDGTNGCIVITDYGDIFAQSRTRILDESNAGDNYGFCKWVNGNLDMLMLLGPGYHYGEWWGKGINRNYGLTDRKFSLFNIWHDEIPECVDVVPIVANTIDEALERMGNVGSIAVPGFMKPEGFVLQSNVHKGVRYKYIIND